MRARGSKSGVKNKTPKLPETRESLGKIGIFLLLKSDFPHTKFDFLQWLSNFLQRLSPFFNDFSIFFNGFSNFFNGFPLSSKALRFFNGFPIFLNGFSLSEKSKEIYLWRQVYKRSLFELRISHHLLPKLRNSC
jgi:hypothetical protein